MATELTLINDTSAVTVYAIVCRDSDEFAWDHVNARYEVLVLANVANYKVALTETPASSKRYVGDFPAGTVNAVHNVIYYQQVGSSPSLSVDSVLGNERITPNGVPPAEASGDDLITLGYYETFVGDSTVAYQALRQQLITEASIAVASYLGYNPKASDYVEVYDGTGMDHLHLRNRPINSITSVVEGYNSGSTTTYSGNSFIWNDAGTIRFKPSGVGSGFYAGRSNYQLTYNAGYVVIPADLKHAVCQVVLAIERLCDPAIVITDKAVGDVKIKFDLRGAFIADNPIFGEAEMLLRAYSDNFGLADILVI